MGTSRQTLQWHAQANPQHCCPLGSLAGGQFSRDQLTAQTLMEEAKPELASLWPSWLAFGFYHIGARVWLRHKEQLLPSTVSSCDDASLVLTTDYGKRWAFFECETSDMGAGMTLKHHLSQLEKGFTKSPLFLCGLNKTGENQWVWLSPPSASEPQRPTPPSSEYSAGLVEQSSSRVWFQLGGNKRERPYSWPMYQRGEGGVQAECLGTSGCKSASFCSMDDITAHAAFLPEGALYLSGMLAAGTDRGPSGTQSVIVTSVLPVIYLQKAELNGETVYPMHPSSVHGVEDMSTLAELHEAAIMHNLLLRYKRDNIYTNIGSILAAVNPYKQISGLYDSTAVVQYSKHQMGELPPHIFAVANECYRCLWKRHDSQCVLISGESGAGKTESTKLLLKFLSVMSQNSAGTPLSERTTRVEQALVQSSPIMEAFGNAKTVYNNNSSRFGKFIQLHFSQNGNIQGGCIIDYLLEKNRVVRQNPGERNYHIFYALLAGADTDHRDMYLLSEGPESYHYLSQSGCMKDSSLDDKQLFDSVMEALKVMEFTEEEIRDVFKLLSAVLQMGNIEFMTAGGAQITSKGVVGNVSELLGLDCFQLSEVLTQRSMILRGEEICSPLTVEQSQEGFSLPDKDSVLSPCCSLFGLAFEAACLLIDFIIPVLEPRPGVTHPTTACTSPSPPILDKKNHSSQPGDGDPGATSTLFTPAVDSRDSVAMALYSQCFSWIIMRINQKIKGKDNFKSIGILDIFGFENFEVNRFEQFNINYANEKLQEYFNKHIFSLEQLEYNRQIAPGMGVGGLDLLWAMQANCQREGIQWEAIDWMDNAECLDLIEKKLGMLALINEESRFPKGTDYTLLEKLHSRHATNPYYVKPRVTDHQFGIKHYAGEVLYDVRGILQKNRDTFRDDILFILKDSRLDFIYDLFERVGSRNGDETMKMGTARRKPTVSSQFRDSLHSLMATLSASNPFFVRCIKPNMDKKANRFDPDVVLNQLRYSGMLETVKIRRAGFPVRRTFKDFDSRYKRILKNKMPSDDEKQSCSELLSHYDETKTEWQLGKSKPYQGEELTHPVSFPSPTSLSLSLSLCHSLSAVALPVPQVFLKEALEQRLEKEREEVRRRAGMVIRAHILSYVA
ncbi:hypothetical protein NQZ68_004404, partial [Dissostichus eleginoides]